MFAEGGDEVGGERNGGLVFEQKREALAELDDETGSELPREIDFDETDIAADEATGWCVAGFGHPGDDARSVLEW